jgi:hypothetical protein
MNLGLEFADRFKNSPRGTKPDKLEELIHL